jgi:hypothetical protein
MNVCLIHKANNKVGVGKVFGSFVLMLIDEVRQNS